MKTKLFFAFLLLISTKFSVAQEGYVSASIGIDGLTCSACSYGTEKSLKKLDFVKEIKMDLNTKTAEIKFIPGKKVSVEALAQKVIDAGFSVRFIKVSFLFKDTYVKENSEYAYDTDVFHFIKTETKQLKGNHTLQFLGKKYLSTEEYKKWKSIIPETKKEGDKKIYYVTLIP